MTFDSKKFGNIGSHHKSGISFQIFSYLGDEDSKATIIAPGYFNGAKESLRRNDLIKVLDRTVTPTTTYELRVSVIPLSGNVLIEELASAGGDAVTTGTGTIVRVGDYISDVETPSGDIYSVSRTDGYIDTVDNGTNVWTFNRDGNNVITDWEVS